jgi:hypothetical protein
MPNINQFRLILRKILVSLNLEMKINKYKGSEILNAGVFRKLILLWLVFTLVACQSTQSNLLKESTGPLAYCPDDNHLSFFKKSGRPLDSYYMCYQKGLKQLIANDELLGYIRLLELNGNTDKAEAILLEANQISNDQKFLRNLGILKQKQGLWDEAAYYFKLAGVDYDDPLWINTAIRSDAYRSQVQKDQVPYVYSKQNISDHQRANVKDNSNVNFTMTRVDDAEPGVLAGETSIISSKDGKNIWVVWTDSSGDYSPIYLTNSWKLRAARSTDGGQAWVNDDFSILPEVTSVFHYDPMTAYDSVNEIIYAGGIMVDTNYSENSFYVKKWNLETDMIEVTRRSGLYDKFLMTVNDEKLYLVEGLERSYYLVSDDFGASFSEIEWNEELGGFTSPQPIFDHEGCMYVVGYSNFLKCDDNGDLKKVNAPTTSLTLFNMDFYLPGAFRSIPLRLIGFHPSDNKIIMIYPDLVSAGSQDVAIWMTQSEDGVVWQEPWIITPDVPGDRFLPWLVVDSKGGIHVSYADTRNMDPNDAESEVLIDMYYSYSSDLGETWSESKVTPTPLQVPSLDIWGDYFFSDYLEMTVADSGDVYMAFPWFDGTGDMDMYVAKKQNDTADFSINQGISGAWYYPATSGSGLFLDIRQQDQFIFTGWFTHDFSDENRPDSDNGSRWFTASGYYAENQANLQIYETSGGLFDDPQQVTNTLVGDLKLQFQNCSEGTVTYQFTDNQGLNGEFPIQRVVPGTEALCEQLNVAASGASMQQKSNHEFIVNQGLSSSWYYPETSGSGLFLDIRPDDQFVFMGWFTHDFTDGDRSVNDNGTRWFTASGYFNANQLNLDVYETSGGLFNNSQEVVNTNVGTVTIDFENCKNAIMTYSFTDDSNLNGEFPIKRVMDGTEILCEYLQD